MGFTSTPALVLLMSMLGIAVFLLLNRARAGFPLALAGLALNIVVIGANGAMPVSAHAIEKISLSSVHPADLRHSVADGDTLLPFLGDVIPLGERVVSIGDVLMFAGLVWFLISTVRSLLWRPGTASLT